MILAAGLGARLGEITAECPKALLEVDGKTLLERTVERLTAAGCDQIVINIHHHAEKIRAVLQERADPSDGSRWHGARILVSTEPRSPLETGGGLKKAAPLFRPGHTILVHNVDVISDIDLAALVRRHESTAALATLAVARREAERHLVFDQGGLCGRLDSRTGREDWARQPGGSGWKAGFTGIHAVSHALLEQIVEEGAFSILDPYLRLASTPGRILAHDTTGCLWLEVGTPERLALARAYFREKTR